MDTVDSMYDWVRQSPAMILTILRLLSQVPAALRPRTELALEHLAPWQQLAIPNPRSRHPRLRRSDRHYELKPK